MNAHTFRNTLRMALPLAATLALSACVVAPYERYHYRSSAYDPYYDGDTVMITRSPQVEYRGYPPAPGYLWLDGSWSWVDRRQVWVPGAWVPPSRYADERRRRERADDRNDDRDKYEWRDDRRRDRDWNERERNDRDRDARRDAAREERREKNDIRQRAEAERAAALKRQVIEDRERAARRQQALQEDNARGPRPSAPASRDPAEVRRWIREHEYRQSE